MKVIKPGRDQQGWSTEANCTGEGNGGGGCGALLLVEEADLYQTTSSARDEVDYYVTFKCTQCGVATDVKNAPPNIRQRVMSEARKKEETERS